jgi:hypothetical protein
MPVVGHFESAAYMREVPTWRWAVFVIFVVLFPIVFHPWWLAILSVALFALLVQALFPNKGSR